MRPARLLVHRFLSTARSAMSSSSSSSTAAASAAAPHAVTINGAQVPVLSSDASVPVEKALASKPFVEWARSIDPQLVVKDITIQGVDMFGPRVGFVKFSANVEFHGRRMPGIVFMRGGGALGNGERGRGAGGERGGRFRAPLNQAAAAASRVFEEGLRGKHVASARGRGGKAGPATRLPAPLTHPPPLTLNFSLNPPNAPPLPPPHSAVAILVILKCETERWVVLCRQPRIPVGRADYMEIPAGMLDESRQFAGVAAKVRGRGRGERGKMGNGEGGGGPTRRGSHGRRLARAVRGHETAAAADVRPRSLSRSRFLL
jgi:hypothetical protein